MVGKAQKSHGVRSELNSLLGLEKVDQCNPIRTSAIQSRSRPMRFLGFSNHEKGGSSEARNFEVINGLQHVLRSGWSFIRSASLAKGGTSKKRSLLRLHKVPTRSNKVRPRTSQTAPIYRCA
jgi:hypothetical protein